MIIVRLIELSVFIGLAAYLIGVARRKFTSVNEAWNDGIIPIVLTAFLLHITVRTLSLPFWDNWTEEEGFLLFQVVLAGAVYFSSVKGKVLWLGIPVIVLALTGVGYNLYSAYEKLPSTKKKAEQETAVIKTPPPPPLQYSHPGLVVEGPAYGLWSDQVLTPHGFGFEVDGPMLVMTSNGKTHNLHPLRKGEKDPDIGSSAWLRFRSQEEEVVHHATFSQ